MKDPIYEFWLPEHLACYIINGDADTLTTDEKNEIDTFLEGFGYFSISDEEHEFRHTNDMNNMGAMCLRFLCCKID